MFIYTGTDNIRINITKCNQPMRNDEIKWNYIIQWDQELAVEIPGIAGWEHLFSLDLYFEWNECAFGSKRIRFVCDILVIYEHEKCHFQCVFHPIVHWLLCDGLRWIYDFMKLWIGEFNKNNQVLSLVYRWCVYECGGSLKWEQKDGGLENFIG